jgi:hypothetical protein
MLVIRLLSKSLLATAQVQQLTGVTKPPGGEKVLLLPKLGRLEIS